MVEVCTRPINGGVAQRAILRKIGGDVVRHARNICSAIVIRGVTAVARRRRARVVIVRVALGALQIRVAVREREKLIVIEICLIPSRRRVTGGASGCGKSSLGVRRIVGAVVIGEVARRAIGRESFVDASRVASGAYDADVLARERERGLSVVVEFTVGPHDCVVARGADGGLEAGLRVRRIVRAVVVGRVASGAGGGSVCIVPARVALRTLQVRVPVGQREKLIVVKGRSIPACGRVARGTSRSREAGLGVRRVVRAVVIGHVA